MRKRMLFSAIPAIAGCFFLAPTAPPADAAPGECQVTSFAGFSGGYCDQAALADGSFNHCETAGAFGLTHQRCYQACLDGAGRPYVTDMDPTTPCVTALVAAPEPALAEVPAAGPGPALAEVPAAGPEIALAEVPAAPGPALAEVPAAGPQPTLAQAPVAPEPTPAPAPAQAPPPTSANSPSPL